MKLFLARLAQFALVTTVLYAAIYAICNFKNYRSVVNVLDCEVLSTCNSHEQCAIDPETFKAYGNLNSVASTPWVWEGKLRLLLGTGKCKPKYLIVERGCHEILWGFSDDDVAQLVARFLPLAITGKTCPYSIDWSKVAHYAIGTRSFTTVWAAKPAGFRPEGMELDIEGRVSEHFGSAYNGLPKKETLEVFEQSLHSLVRTAIENGIEPVLLSTPKHAKYLAAEPENVRALNSRITQGLLDTWKIRYLDYSTFPLDDTCYADADHLNPLGRKIFTRKLMEDLGYGDNI